MNPGRNLPRLVAGLLSWPLAFGLVSCKSDDDDGGVPLKPGVVTSELPDSRVFIVPSPDGELFVLDGNDPTERGVSEALDLGGESAAAVALDPHGNRFWIVLPDTNRVLILDTRTLNEVGEVTTGARPVAVVIDGLRGRAFVANSNGNSVSVFSADPPFAEAAASPVLVGASPVDVIVIDDRVATANRDGDSFSLFAATPPFDPVVGSPFPVGASPVDLEVDPAERILFIASQGDGTISVYNRADDMVTTPIVGLAGPAQIARHRRRDLLFVADTDATLKVYTSQLSPAPDPASPVNLGQVPGGVAVNGFLDRVTLTFPAFGTARTHSGESPFAEIDPNRRPFIAASAGLCFGVEPVLLQTLTDPSGGNLERTTREGIHLYLAYGATGMPILRDTDPRADYLTRREGLLAVPGEARDVTVASGFAYIGNGGNGVQIARVTNPASPVIEKTVDGIGSVDEVVRLNNFLVLDQGSAVRTLEVRIPTDPIVFPAVPVGGSGSGFAVSVAGRRSYHASGGTDLFVVSLFDLFSPLVIETIDVPVAALDVTDLGASSVAIASGVGGLRTATINPPSSFLRAQIDLAAAVNRVQSFRDLAFATLANGQLVAVNVASLDNPVELGTLVPAATARDVKVFGNFLYVSAGAVGLEIYRFLP